jgi:hypothetical protein
MNRTRLRAIVLSVIVIVVVAAGYTIWRKQPSVLAHSVLSDASKVEVFRLDPKAGRKPGEGRIGGWLITAQGKDQGSEFAAKLDDVLRDNRTFTDKWAKCYDPGVAFRAWRGNECVDVIICFKCSNFYYGPPTEFANENACFGGSPRKADLVKLAKESFPDDPAIQELK